ncbi:MAG: hypothetical protein P4M10_07940 [Verrucomicrobiae bacterium]|nr:hypothetical protein [Verrucomicrobiae bacterium]
MTPTPSRPAEAATFLEPPDKKPTKRKWLIALFLFVLAIGFYMRSLATSDEFRGLTQKAPGDYHQTHCPADEKSDLSASDMDRISIKLAPDCFHGLITNPVNWGGYTVTLSMNEGDWVSVWCNGHREPGRIRYGYQHDEALGGTMENCRDGNVPTDSYWVQGRGTLTLIRTRKKHQAGILEFFGLTH